MHVDQSNFKALVSSKLEGEMFLSETPLGRRSVRGACVWYGCAWCVVSLCVVCVWCVVCVVCWVCVCGMGVYVVCECVCWVCVWCVCWVCVWCVCYVCVCVCEF